MRIGWLAAAMAILLAAGQADAAKWVRYTASGLGDVTEYDVDKDFPTGGMAEFRYSFTIDVEPSSLDDSDHESNGSSFYKPFIGGDSEVFAAASPTSLGVTEHFYSYGGEVFNNVTISFDRIRSFTGFPLIAPRNITGTMNYRDGGRLQSVRAVGTLNRLRIIEVAGYAAPSFDATIFGVPEPATWGMMIIGFGLTGTAMRRKKPAFASRKALSAS